MNHKNDKIIFKCPECGRNLSVGEDKKGITARCPGCGKRITIPKQNKTK